MIHKIIAFSIRNKLIVALMTFALIGGGIWSLSKVPIDAVPDITNNQVQVITQAPNLGTEDIEQFVSYPVEVAMANLPGVIEIRSISRFGLSVVTIVFEDEMGTYLPRQLVGEKLSTVQQSIPKGFGTPAMGPISTGLGEILQYTLKVDSAYQGRYSTTELRTIQDWIVRRQMALVPGVVEVNAFGGNILQYEVSVNPDELNAVGITITDVFTALERNNQNTGGAYIEKSHNAHFIRGEGLVRNIDEIEQILVANIDGLPITVGDIAEVKRGKAVRYGAFTKDGQGESVGGIVFMLKGASSNEVIAAVKERLKKINASLPPGIEIDPFLDRSELIDRTTGTIQQNLTEGALIVIFVLVILLGNWRGGLIVASTIPLSLLFAFILMHAFDVWANLMSLGAIDFGIIVDGAVIIVEGTVFMLTQKMGMGKTIDRANRESIALKASSKMMRSAFFGQLIILLVFVPILALEGVEGKMFQPMALTFMFAMVGVMLLCLTYVPMMSAWFLRVSPTSRIGWGDRIVKRIENAYEKALIPALRHGRFILLVAIGLLALAIFTFTRMGGEFVPQLDEGDIAFHIILKPGSSLSESVATSTKIEQILLSKFPEIEHAMSRFGVAEVPTDPMPMDLGDCFIVLKPQDEWVSASSKPELIEKIKAELAHLPGLTFEFSQPIEMRFNELITGVREDIAVKIFGEDLDTLAQKAEEMGALIAPIAGVGDIRVEATTGLPQMTVQYNRQKLAQYGVDVATVNRVIETAFAGGHAGVIFQGEKRFDLVVRLAEHKRQNIQNLKNLYIPISGGTQVPLKELAAISYHDGPMQISRDNTNRRVYVGINVRGRDVQSLVEEIQSTLDEKLKLPPGYYVRYGGAFENLERATKRLQLLVPIALALIFVLIFFALQSVPQTAMIYMAIPLAAIGGVFSLWLRDMPFSISAGIGFIVLFGVAVLNGLVLISSWNDLKEEGMNDLKERIRVGARQRVRPILLTALTDILGFLPMAISTSAGAEVQRPLATVVIGGMISATLLTLFVLPILYKWSESTSWPKPKAVYGAIAIGVMATILPMSSNAQTTKNPLPISLEKAVERATSRVPKLKAARLSVEGAQAERKTAWDFGNTTVFTSGEEIGNGEGVYTTIGVQQQNIDLLGIPSSTKLQRERVVLAEKALSLSELELRYTVKQSYGKLYVSQMRWALYQELDSLFSDFERAARLRFETEETSKLAFLAAANQAGQMSAKADQAFRDYQIALQRFNLWMVSDTLYTVVPTGQTEQSWNIAQIDTLQHPVIDFASQELQVATQALKVTRSDFLPKFNFLYGAQEINGQTGFYQYQLGITFPLIFSKQQGRVQSARIAQQVAAETLEQTQLELENQYVLARQEFLKWQRTWKYYQSDAIPLAQEQREGAWVAFESGSIDYITFLQNARDAMRLELEAWNTFQQYLDSRFRLEYLNGK